MPESHAVLIVDDEVNMYDFLEMKLGMQDTRLYFAVSGEDALRMAAEILPDVILLDVMMPGMDGFDTCRQLRANPTVADIPIIMITALDDYASHLMGYKVGVDDFFTKPVDQIILLTRIKNILQMNRYRKQMEERAQFAEKLEIKNRQLRELSNNLLEIQEKERRFIAAELHDDLGQLLTGLKLMLELAAFQSGADQAQTLEKARALVGEMSLKIRNLSLDLRPAMLDDFGLFAALEWLFERYSKQTRVKIIHNFSFMNECRFPRPVETAAFRIIQESLTNVARHSDSPTVNVNIWVKDNLEIEISDYGRGFDIVHVESKNHQSTGISSMRERVALLGGEFSIASSPGSGTVVKAIFDLQEEAENVQN